MTEKTITCIECPKGCLITVRLDGSKIVEISGFSCTRGKTYAENSRFGVYNRYFLVFRNV